MRPFFPNWDDIGPRIQAVDFVDVDIVPSVEFGFGLSLEAGQREAQGQDCCYSFHSFVVGPHTALRLCGVNKSIVPSARGYTYLIGIQHLFPVGIGNPFRFVRLAVEIDHHGVTQRLDFACFAVAKALLHLEAGVAYLGDAALAHNRVVEKHGMAEIQVHVDEDVFECEPVDFGLEDMLEIAASTHVEIIALRPVVDVVVRVKVAHSDLDGTREHFLLNR